MIVELTAAQRTLLRELVGEALEEVGPEIHHTRTSGYKADLKERRQTLKSLRDLFSDVPEEEHAAI
jgi:hypothetical protein